MISARRPGGPNRLDFAQWLMAPENPLTARVAVNRAWQRLFGAGIVATSNDFGTQGEPPTHPELLDWLASEFRDHQWQSKAIDRLLVTSASLLSPTHRQHLSRLLVLPLTASVSATTKLLTTSTSTMV